MSLVRTLRLLPSRSPLESHLSLSLSFSFALFNLPNLLLVFIPSLSLFLDPPSAFLRLSVRHSRSYFPVLLCLSSTVLSVAIVTMLSLFLSSSLSRSWLRSSCTSASLSVSPKPLLLFYAPPSWPPVSSSSTDRDLGHSCSSRPTLSSQFASRISISNEMPIPLVYINVKKSFAEISYLIYIFNLSREKNVDVEILKL